MEAVETQKPSLVSHALKSGLYIGIFNAILTLLIYVIDPTIMVSMWFGIIILVINLALVIYFGSQYRKSVGGYLSFGPSFGHGYVTLVAAGLISIIFQILLYTVIDPELPELLARTSIENTVSMMESMGVSGSELDEQMYAMEESTKERFGVSGLLMGFVWSLLIYAIVALITGAFVKRNEPIDNI